MFPTEKPPKISAKFICEKCDYKCSKQSEYNKHILTNKHKILHNPTLNPTSEISEKIYECNCGKIYKHSSTLYTHKKNVLQLMILKIMTPTVMTLIITTTKLKN